MGKKYMIVTNADTITEEMLICTRCGEEISMSDTIRFTFDGNKQLEQRAQDRLGSTQMVVICSVCFAEVLWRGQTFWR